MKALSVRAPWWWFILHGGKDIENRNWATSFRGTIYLHASSWWKKDEVIRDIATAIEIAGWFDQRDRWPKLREMHAHRGCIVGKVDIVGCVEYGPSPWLFGRYGFVLANPVAFERPVPFKGALGFFDVPDGIEIAA
jgi:hypothetical protein